MVFTNKTQKAYDMALVAHSGQRDMANKDYIEHVLSVAKDMPTEELTCVALLHDVLEDSHIFTLEQIYSLFGCDIGYAVNLLTRKPDETYWRYIKSLATNDLARQVKIADLTDNCRLDRFKDNQRWLKLKAEKLIKERYEPALKYLAGISNNNNPSQ